MSNGHDVYTREVREALGLDPSPREAAEDRDHRATWDEHDRLARNRATAATNELLAMNGRHTEMLPYEPDRRDVNGDPLPLARELEIRRRRIAELYTR